MSTSPARGYWARGSCPTAFLGCASCHSAAVVANRWPTLMLTLPWLSIVIQPCTLVAHRITTTTQCSPRYPSSTVASRGESRLYPGPCSRAPASLRVLAPRTLAPVEPHVCGPCGRCSAVTAHRPCPRPVSAACYWRRVVDHGWGDDPIQRRCSPGSGLLSHVLMRVLTQNVHLHTAWTTGHG